jgi:hypothetical protein
MYTAPVVLEAGDVVAMRRSIICPMKGSTSTATPEVEAEEPEAAGEKVSMHLDEAAGAATELLKRLLAARLEAEAIACCNHEEDRR